MDLDKQLMSACACFGSATLPEVAPVRSSEQAAEAVKNAHWEGTKVADASDWKINDESCYDADFEYVGPGETRLSGFRAGWRRVLGGLLDAVADWRWNLRVVVPDEGFDVVDGFIEVPYRISPTCVARKGAVLAFEGREFVVRADTEVVLPTEIVLAHVDATTMLICRGIHEGTGLRPDGKRINSGGLGLPAGVLHACGFDPDAPDEPEPSSLFAALPNPFGAGHDADSRWT
jgi:hypothetical protein